MNCQHFCISNVMILCKEYKRNWISCRYTVHLLFLKNSQVLKIVHLAMSQQIIYPSKQLKNEVKLNAFNSPSSFKWPFWITFHSPASNTTLSSVLLLGNDQSGIHYCTLFCSWFHSQSRKFYPKTDCPHFWPIRYIVRHLLLHHVTLIAVTCTVHKLNSVT